VALDLTNPEVAAAVEAIKSETRAAVAAEYSVKIGEVAAAKATVETAAADALAALATAKAAGESTAAELATLKAKADAAETRAATLEAADTARQTAADAAVVAALPDALRPLVAGKTGAELKAAADTLQALANRAVPGKSGAEGSTTAAPTEPMLAWAIGMGLSDVSDKAKIVSAYNKIGPGRKLAATS